MIQNLFSNPIERVSEAQTTASKPYVHGLSKTESITMQGLFSDLANRSYFWLFRNRSRMNQYGENLAHLHPLSFLEHSIVNSYRREDLVKIKNKGALVWGHFTQILKDHLKKEEVEGNLKPYLSAFAQALKLPKEDILQHIQNQNMDKLINQAIEVQKSIAPEKNSSQILQEMV